MLFLLGWHFFCPLCSHPLPAVKHGCCMPTGTKKPRCHGSSLFVSGKFSASDGLLALHFLLHLETQIILQENSMYVCTCQSHSSPERVQACRRRMPTRCAASDVKTAWARGYRCLRYPLSAHQLKQQTHPSASSSNDKRRRQDEASNEPPSLPGSFFRKDSVAALSPPGLELSPRG